MYYTVYIPRVLQSRQRYIQLQRCIQLTSFAEKGRSTGASGGKLVAGATVFASGYTRARGARRRQKRCPAVTDTCICIASTAAVAGLRAFNILAAVTVVAVRADACARCRVDLAIALVRGHVLASTAARAVSWAASILTCWSKKSRVADAVTPIRLL